MAAQFERADGVADPGPSARGVHEPQVTGARSEAASKIAHGCELAAKAGGCKTSAAAVGAAGAQPPPDQ